MSDQSTSNIDQSTAEWLSRPKTCFTNPKISWAAGLFEGEGSIFCDSHKRATAAVNMTDRDVVERFAAVAQMGTIRGPYKYSASNNHKPTWVWRIQGYRRVARLFTMFEPWLCSRRTARFKEVLASCGRHPPTPCGTLSGYRRHCRNHETPCDQCRAAYNTHAKNLRRKHRAANPLPPRPPRPRPPCGTDSGYRHHIYMRETTCDQCRTAHAICARQKRLASKLQGEL